MDDNKTNIIIIDKHHKSENNKKENISINGNNDDGKNHIPNRRENFINLIIIVLMMLIVFLVLKISDLSNKVNTYEVELERMRENERESKQRIYDQLINEKPKLASELFEDIFKKKNFSKKRPIEMLDKDIDLWVDTYGESTYLIEYYSRHYMDSWSIFFKSDKFEGEFEELVNMMYYDNSSYGFTSMQVEECINNIIDKLKEKYLFTNCVTVKTINYDDEYFVINKDRIISIKESYDESTKKNYLEIEMPYENVIKTSIDNKDKFLD